MSEEHGISRMQELLSSYYGLADSQRRTGDHRDIDSSSFDSNAYVKNMLESMGMNDLLRRDDELVREVKELDTNMQMLVYENYNKFISATDTIRKMKNNVSGMENDMEQVMTKMDSIIDKSERINTALAPQRGKVEKLIGVHRLLKRLEFIFELPQRLKQAVKKEEYANATKYFLLARRILGRYEHITSFQTIQKEAEKIVEGLETILIRRLSDPKLTSDQICEAVELLSQLNACTDDMKKQFLSWHEVYFTAKLKDLQSLTEGTLGIHVLQQLDDTFLVPFMRVLQVYKETFAPSSSEDNKEQPPESSSTEEDPLQTFATDLFNKYLEMSTTQLQRPSSELGNPSDVHKLESERGSMEESIEAHGSATSDAYFVLMWTLKGVLSQAQEVDEIFPSLQLASGAVKTVESCIQYHLGTVFDQLHLTAIELFEATDRDVRSLRQSETSVAIVESGKEAAKSFSKTIQTCLRQTQPLLQSGSVILPEMSSLFPNLLQAQFYHFLRWLMDAALVYMEGDRGDFCGLSTGGKELPKVELHPLFFVYLYQVYDTLAVDGLNDCIEALSACIPPSSPTAVSSRRKHLDGAYMTQLLRDVAFNLLQHSAKTFGQQVCGTLHQGLQTSAWTEVSEEPRSVQEMVVVAMETVQSVQTQLMKAFHENPSPVPRNRTNATRRQPTALRSNGNGARGMRLDVENIFSEKVVVFQPAPDDLSSTWFAQYMLKMSIKAYNEWLRKMDLSKFALQQVQLNAEFMRSCASQLVTEPKEMEQLLSELLSNGRDRALDDTLMEHSKVTAIVSTKMAGFHSKQLK